MLLLPLFPRNVTLYEYCNEYSYALKKKKTNLFMRLFDFL